MNPIKVTHVLPGLDIGGAELMLTHLVSGMDPFRFENRVISMTSNGVLGERLTRMGIEVTAMGMGSVPDPISVARLALRLRRDAPDVVQTWLYAADLVGGIVARSIGIRNIVWNIRQSAPRRHQDPLRHVWTSRACAMFSSFVPRSILSCSEDGRRSHQALGYTKAIEVIPNGFDLYALGRDPMAAHSVRTELAIGTKASLVGMVARSDPVKGHRDFLEAASQVIHQQPDAHFLLCGEGVVATNTELATWTRLPQLAGRVHLLGRRSDVPRLLAALDVFVSSSHSEGFPNVIGEAMASSVPCVVTDVGDSASLLGGSGLVVPSQSPQDLANAIISVLTLAPEARNAMGAAARRRVEKHYSIPTIVDRYSHFYEGLMEPERGRQGRETTCRAVI